MNGAALLLALTFAADVKPTSHFDRIAVRLSESVTVTLAVEGPAPLRVELPADLLDEHSAPAWRLRPMGSVSVENLPEGRQRWSQKFRADPYRPGDKVRLGFVPGQAYTGANAQPQAVEWPAVEVKVATEVIGDLSELRPPTGIEALPPRPSQPVPAWGWALGLAALGATVLAGGIIFQRLLRKRSQPLPPREWADRELDRLAADSPDGPIFAERLSTIVRQFVELRSPLPASKLTTAELLSRLGPDGGWPAEVVEEVSLVLDRCDVTKFAPTPGAADREALLATARRVIAAMGPAS